MWKTKLLKLVYGLNARLNFADLKILRALKQFGRHLIFRILAPNEQILINIDGMSFYIHFTPASIQEYVLQLFEPYTTELFKRSVKPRALVLDIGAQFGYYSLLAAKFVGPEGQVFAFEPDPTNFKILKKNIQLNNYSSIVYPIPKAVGDRKKTVTLFRYKDSDSHGMFCHPEAIVKETISVECITIDEFLGGQPVDVIKMDIEGNEPYALEGMKQIIAKSNNLILFTELCPMLLEKVGVEPEEYLAQLKSLGFDIKIIDERSYSLRSVTKDFPIGYDPFWHVNLYCTKS